MNDFYAEIRYDKKNIERMARCVCYAHSLLSPMIVRAAGYIVTVMGFWRAQTQLKTGCVIMAVGVLLITGAGVRGRGLARKMCEFMEGWWPLMKFHFNKNALMSETDRERSRTQYGTVTRLVDDGKFLYVFTGPATAFMIDPATIRPGGRDDLMLFLMDRTGLDWSPSNRSLLHLSLRLWIKNRSLRAKLDGKGTPGGGAGRKGKG